jgi:hypothetical protein
MQRTGRGRTVVTFVPTCIGREDDEIAVKGKRGAMHGGRGWTRMGPLGFRTELGGGGLRGCGLSDVQ